MCPGRPYMLGGGTSPRGLCRRRRSWRGASKAWDRYLLMFVGGADDLASRDAALATGSR
jgi:hypothetical protein